MGIDKKLFEGLVREAAEKISYWNWDSFAISTQIPKEWIVQEEKDWDKKLDGKCTSVKNAVNSRLIHEIASATGKKYDPINADGRISFDFSSKKVSAEFEPVFVFGRYKKLEAGLSQSRWMCGKCEGDGCFKCDWKGKYYVSVEELMGDVFKEITEAKDYSLHASGREDVDVVNLAGRPFVLELIKPKNRKIDLGTIAAKINADKKVEVLNLRIVSRGFVEAVTESHFEKEYETEVEFSKDIDEGTIAKILAFAGKIVVQRTPKRVAHRRADLKRQRKIVGITFLGREGNVARFRILAEAGTYIKELVHGDAGRTETSFSSIAGCDAKCVSLKVTKIYDEFLDVILS